MQSVKERLKHYLEIIEENNLEIARYEELEKSGVTSPEKLKAIEAQIIARTNFEIEEKEYIKNTISALRSMPQRKVMSYRYLDCLPWNTITKIMYQHREDFETDFEKYKRKVFKLHKRALSNIESTQSMY